MVPIVIMRPIPIALSLLMISCCGSVIIGSIRPISLISISLLVSSLSLPIILRWIRMYLRLISCLLNFFPMTVLSKKVLARRASHLFKWFEIDLTIKMFGKVIFHWHYPPESDQLQEFVEYDDDQV